MPESPNILLFGLDHSLTHTRGLLLSRAGFKVRAVENLADFELKGDLLAPDVVVLCHTLSVEECARALELAEARWPTTRRLVLTTGTTPIPERAQRDAMEAAVGPGMLIAQVLHLAGSPANSYARTS